MCTCLCTWTLSDFSLHLFTIDGTLSVACRSTIASLNVCVRECVWACIVELYLYAADGATPKTKCISSYSHFKYFNWFFVYLLSEPLLDACSFDVRHLSIYILNENEWGWMDRKNMYQFSISFSAPQQRHWLVHVLTKSKHVADARCQTV